MSFVTTDSYSFGAVDQSIHDLVVTLNGSWNVVTNSINVYFIWTPSGGSSDSGPNLTSPPRVGYAEGSNSSGSYFFDVGRVQVAVVTNAKMVADKTHSFSAWGDLFNQGGSFVGSIHGGTLTFKTNSVTATASTPTSSAITSSTATIACNFFPNTNESTATVWLEYRVFGGSTWTQAGATGSYSGYSTQSISRNLTGLAGNITYEYRLNMTRTTNDGTTFQSTISTFTTSPSTPTDTTNSTTNLGPTVATLNGTVNPQGLSNVTYAFVWGTTLGGPYPNRTADQGPSSGSSDIPYSADITGLTATTVYYYKAVATYSSTDYFGSEVSFTTAASAAQARIMPSIINFVRPYGTQATFEFPLEVPSATNSDRFVTTVPGSLFVSGDIKIDKDGGGFNTVTNVTPTQPTAGIGSYILTLTATEMQAGEISVTVVDQNGPAWRDTMLKIVTVIAAGKVVLDASPYGGNVDGFKSTGIGTGVGINAVGGATSAGDITGVLSSHVIRKNTAQAGAASSITLDASASSTNNYYNNAVVMIVSGTGVGQFRVITGYTGSTQVATVNRSWAVNPSSSSVFIILPADDVWNISPTAELASVPTGTSTFANMTQALFGRFFFSRTQTATTQTLYKSDSATTLGAASVADNGVTQTSGKIS